MRAVHVFRTPVGGLFRHVRDVVRGHQALGIQSGIICDSSTGGDNATALLASLEPHCALGVVRIPISRLPGIGDIGGARAVAAEIRKLKPDIVHGHGAKGGLYGRLAARLTGVPSVYTPHGGSLHYAWAGAGSIYLGAEVLLRRAGSGLIFVCDFEKSAFDAKIGIGGKPHKIIYNGLWPEELSQVSPFPGHTDIIYVGELRLLKGVDVLLEAMARLQALRPVTATIVGGGEDSERFKAQAASLGLADRVTFTGPLPARQAFARGRLFVMPSRAESFPYVVLEASAAGLPIVASNVGGIPEVLPASRLVPPGDVAALAGAIRIRLNDPALMDREAAENTARVASRFSCGQMCAEIAAFYRDLTQSAAAA